MKTLELKHIAPYLIYGVKVYDGVKPCLVKGYRLLKGELRLRLLMKEEDVSETFYTPTIECVKPILRPLSDLNYNNNPDIFDEIWEIHGDFMTDGSDFKDIDSIQAECEMIPFSKWIQLYDWLLENHFDVFGLIDQGLAISIHEIESK